MDYEFVVCVLAGMYIIYRIALWRDRLHGSVDYDDDDHSGYGI